MGAPDAPRVLAGPVRALSHNLQRSAIIASLGSSTVASARAGRMASGSRLTGFPLERTGTLRSSRASKLPAITVFPTHCGSGYGQNNATSGLECGHP